MQNPRTMTRDAALRRREIDRKIGALTAEIKHCQECGCFECQAALPSLLESRKELVFIKHEAH